MKDFTLKIYKELLTAFKQQQYSFFTFQEWCNKVYKTDLSRSVILRHDVDLKAENSLKTAIIEHDLGICASYYFRVVPQSNNPKIIREIAALGHEIGYHYEDLSITNGNIEEGFEHFKKWLTYFQDFYPVKTICMHGSPKSKYDNRDLWKNYDYHDLGLIGEPYLDFLNRPDIIYFTDTGRMWDGNKYSIRDKIAEENINNQPKVHNTMSLIKWINESDNFKPIMVTTHPQRWTDNSFSWIKEYICQGIKNQIKRLITN